MDFSLSRIRAKNIFKDTFKPSDPSELGSVKKLFNPTPMVPSDDSSDNDTSDNNSRRASKLLMDEYSSPSIATERYNKFLGDQPNEADYHASKKRTLAGILTGALLGFSNPSAGAEVGSKIITQPFDDKLSDWIRKEAPLKAAATSEGAAKTQRINALKDYIQSEHNKLMDTSLSESRRSEAAHRLATEKLGRESLINTVANQQALERNRTVDDARADAAAKEIARHNLETERTARANTENTRARVNIYKSSQENLNAYRDHLRNKMATEKKDSPSAQRTAEELATHDTILKPGNSQKYADFYEIDDNGRIHVTPPSKSYFSNDEDFNAQLAEYSKFRKEIDDGKNVILKSSPNNTKDQKPTPKDKNTPRVVRMEIIQ